MNLGSLYCFSFALFFGGPYTTTTTASLLVGLVTLSHLVVSFRSQLPLDREAGIL